MLEALAALVILGASAAGFLGVFQNAAQSMHSASEWNRASAVAQAALEDAVRERLQGATIEQQPGMADGFKAQVESAPWSATVDDLVVHVTLPDGRTMTVHRLVRRR